MISMYHTFCVWPACCHASFLDLPDGRRRTLPANHQWLLLQQLQVLLK